MRIAARFVVLNPHHAETPFPVVAPPAAPHTHTTHVHAHTRTHILRTRPTVPTFPSRDSRRFPAQNWPGPAQGNALQARGNAHQGGRRHQRDATKNQRPEVSPAYAPGRCPVDAQLTCTRAHVCWASGRCPVDMHVRACVFGGEGGSLVCGPHACVGRTYNPRSLHVILTRHLGHVHGAQVRV